MAKDPAINWYFDNWDGGTKLFTRHQKGCYMDLLSAQFHSGPLSLENVKTVLGSDFQAVWPVISKKFEEKDGLFFNERLETERQKRIAYSESRSKNRGKKDMKNISNSYVKHMKNIPGTGIGTETEITKGGVGEKVELPRSGFFSDSLDPGMPLDQNHVDMTIQYIDILTKKTITSKEVTDYWKAFKIQQFAKHEWYNDTGALIGHFRDQLKNQLNKTNGNSSLSKVGRELERDKP